MGKTKDLSKEITIVEPNFNEIPAFMQDETDLGMELLKEYVRPPFIKIVQKGAAKELIDAFTVGDVISSPSNSIIAEMPCNDKGRPLDGAVATFKVIPILFYPEWVSWTPIKLKGIEPVIRYRTIDPEDPIVAKSRNKNLRSEPHPDHPDDAAYNIRHCEHLNFLVVLKDHPLSGTVMVLSFSRGGFGDGCKFSGLLKMRNAPIYGCVFEAVVTLRPNPAGDWYGIGMRNPEDGKGWVDDADEYAAMKALHIEYEKLRQEAKIQAGYDPEEIEKDAAATKATEEM